MSSISRPFPAPAATTFYDGVETSLSITLTNPYSGEQVPRSGTFYVNDTYLFGGTGMFDTIIATSLVDHLYRIEDDSLNLLLDGFETFILGDGNDTLILSSSSHTLGDLTLLTGEGDDLIWSNAGNDTIDGDEGDDIIHGGPGNDDIRGGSDFDIASYSGPYSNYVIVDSSGVLTITDTVGSDGVDTLTDMELLQFTDGTLENGVFTPTVATVPTMGAAGVVVLACLLLAVGIRQLRGPTASL